MKKNKIFTIQAVRLQISFIRHLIWNLQVHHISGFDIDKAKSELMNPKDFEPVVMLTVGYITADKDILNTNTRKNINEFVLNSSSEIL